MLGHAKCSRPATVEPHGVLPLPPWEKPEDISAMDATRFRILHRKVFMHRQNVDNAKTTLDAKQSDRELATCQTRADNLRRSRTRHQQEAARELKNQNAWLVERLCSVVRESEARQRQLMSTPREYPGTNNTTARRKESQRVDNENKLMLDRLKRAGPVVTSRGELEERYKAHRKLVYRHSRFKKHDVDLANPPPPPRMEPKNSLPPWRKSNLPPLVRTPKRAPSAGSSTVPSPVSPPYVGRTVRASGSRKNSEHSALSTVTSDNDIARTGSGVSQVVHSTPDTVGGVGDQKLAAADQASSAVTKKGAENGELSDVADQRETPSSESPVPSGAAQQEFAPSIDASPDESDPEPLSQATPLPVADPHETQCDRVETPDNITQRSDAARAESPQGSESFSWAGLTDAGDNRLSRQHSTTESDVRSDRVDAEQYCPVADSGVGNEPGVQDECSVRDAEPVAGAPADASCDATNRAEHETDKVPIAADIGVGSEPETQGECNLPEEDQEIPAVSAHADTNFDATNRVETTDEVPTIQDTGVGSEPETQDKCSLPEQYQDMLVEETAEEVPKAEDTGAGIASLEAEEEVEANENVRQQEFLLAQSTAMDEVRRISVAISERLSTPHLHEAIPSSFAADASIDASASEAEFAQNSFTAEASFDDSTQRRSESGPTVRIQSLCPDRDVSQTYEDTFDETYSDAFEATDQGRFSAADHRNAVSPSGEFEDESATNVKNGGFIGQVGKQGDAPTCATNADSPSGEFELETPINSNNGGLLATVENHENCDVEANPDYPVGDFEDESTNNSKHGTFLGLVEKQGDAPTYAANAESPSGEFEHEIPINSNNGGLLATVENQENVSAVEANPDYAVGEFEGESTNNSKHGSSFEQVGEQGNAPTYATNADSPSGEFEHETPVNSNNGGLLATVENYENFDVEANPDYPVGDFEDESTSNSKHGSSLGPDEKQENAMTYATSDPGDEDNYDDDDEFEADGDDSDADYKENSEDDCPKVTAPKASNPKTSSVDSRDSYGSDGDDFETFSEAED